MISSGVWFGCVIGWVVGLAIVIFLAEPGAVLSSACFLAFGGGLMLFAQVVAEIILEWRKGNA